jgi:V-type H+-transporting ATPase subunit A
VGDRVTTGDIYAKVPENTLIEHRICVPIGARGNVTWIAPQGEYNINDEVLEIEFGGEKKVCDCNKRFDRHPRVRCSSEAQSRPACTGSQQGRPALLGRRSALMPALQHSLVCPSRSAATGS